MKINISTIPQPLTITIDKPDAIVNLIGGITKKQAKEILNKFKTTKNKKETA